MSQDACILVINDEALDVKRVLTSAGYRVLDASTGGEGLRLAQDEEPDLIVLDVMLPDIGGLEVCRRLKADAACAKGIILLFSDREGSSSTQTEGLEAGADDILVRPISNQELLTLVRAMLKVKRAEDELRRQRSRLEELVELRTTELRQINAQLHQEVLERKQAENALKRSEERFRLLYERAPLGYQSLDEEGYFLEVNQAWLDTLDFGRDEVIGRWFGEFLAPEHVEHFRQNFPRFKAVGEIAGVEFEMVKKDGTHILVTFDGKIGYDTHGRFQQTHCILHDITIRKQADETLRASEARYRELFNNMSSGVAVYQAVDDGQDFVFTDFNRAGERIDGIGKTAVIGQRLTHVFPEVKKFGLFDVLVRVWQTGTSKTFPATKYQDERLIGWRENYVYKLPSGEVVAVYDDITEQKQAEFELRTAQKATEEANRKLLEQQQQIQKQNRELQEVITKKDKFFSIVAHDIKNPLSSFVSFVNLFSTKLDQWNPDEISPLVEALRENVENLSALLDNLLTWARLEQGRLEFYPQLFDIHLLVTRNVSLLNQMAEQKQITLHNSVENSMPVYADINRLGTVIRNLLANALKFTMPGGTVTISATQHADSVMVAVADTGVGIAEDMVDAIFRIDMPYQKVGTVGEKGTGLGLILCKEFVEKNGGRIWVESEQGKGSTFYFTVPGANSIKTECRS